VAEVGLFPPRPPIFPVPIVALGRQTVNGPAGGVAELARR